MTWSSQEHLFPTPISDWQSNGMRWVRDSCCVSIQGLHPSKDPAFVVFEDKSFRETLLTRQPLLNGTVQPLEHFLVASLDVLPLRHDFCRPGPQKWRSTPRAVAIFSLFSFFFGHAKILEYVRPWRVVAVRLPKTGKRRSVCGLHLEEPLNWGRACTALWRHWPSVPELRHSKCESHLSAILHLF